MLKNIQRIAHSARAGYSRSVRVRWLILAVVLVALATGCPRGTRPTRMLPDVPSTGDPEAKGRFQEARARFERDQTTANPSEFMAIARDFPADPVAPFARFFAGRASFRASDYPAAVTAFTAVSADESSDPRLRQRAELFLGLSYGYLGQHQDALRILEHNQATENDHERGERLAVMAEAQAALSHHVAAFALYDQWYQLATESERAFILARVREVSGQLQSAEAHAAYRGLQRRAGPTAVVLAERLAADAAASGDHVVAERLRAEALSARRAIGLPTTVRERAAGDPGLVGAALPLSGKRSRVGDAAARGLGIAAGTFDRRPGAGVGADGVPRPFVLVTQDATSESSAAGNAIVELARRGAIAVVGPLDSGSVQMAAERADEFGIPVVALDTAGGGLANSSPYVFHVVIPAEARARALARYAAKRGVKRFAILRPNIDYGARAAAAFRGEVEALGGAVVAEGLYGDRDTSFGGPVAGIAGKPWDAVFIPDVARRLELVVPALAAANLRVAPPGTPAPAQGRNVMLLSTAESLQPDYLRGSGRYSYGAVFAPGFYADDNDRRIGSYVQRFSAAFRRSPSYMDAYAYDAALAIRAAVESGAETRAEVSAALAASVVEGLTGSIQFNSARRRSDQGLLFVVEKDEGGNYRIRAQR
jgi:branched-chain amino acid transport system substrate-binding protein